MSTFEQRHGRPKPPKLWEGGCHYEQENPEIFTVLKDRNCSLWAVWSQGHEISTFDTHAEAITWAQKYAHK